MGWQGTDPSTDFRYVDKATTKNLWSPVLFFHLSLSLSLGEKILPDFLNGFILKI